jgi:Flp pilus assembly protein TadG
MAIIAPVLLLLLFGIIEIGILAKNSMMLHSACREGARAAAIGATPAEVADRCEAAAATLNVEVLGVTTEYRTYSDGSWGSWQTLGYSDDGNANDAPTGSHIRVELSYDHPLVAGALFSFLADDQENNTVNIGARMVMMRE